ncbi:MAG: hypothetical protein FIB08_03650 [Candidatus Methanoperedens sp.]|nr:hypothetical protein [Candidatus Methanoperedens sp.]
MVKSKTKTNKRIVTAVRTKNHKESKTESKIQKVSILSALLEFLTTSQKKEFTKDDADAWIKKHHPDLKYKPVSLGLHLSALRIGAHSSPSINKHSCLEYSKETKKYIKVS